MEIFNFVSTLVSVSFCCRCILSLETYYPPKTISDANFCFFDWTIEAAYCNSRTRPAFERTLFRLEGEKVSFFFSGVILLLILMLLPALKISQTYSTSWNYRDDGSPENVACEEMVTCSSAGFTASDSLPWSGI